MGWFLAGGSSEVETAVFLAAQVWEPFEGLWGFAGRTRAVREAGLSLPACVRCAWNAGLLC